MLERVVAPVPAQTVSGAKWQTVVSTYVNNRIHAQGEFCNLQP